MIYRGPLLHRAKTKAVTRCEFPHLHNFLRQPPVCGARFYRDLQSDARDFLIVKLREKRDLSSSSHFLPAASGCWKMNSTESLVVEGKGTTSLQEIKNRRRSGILTKLNMYLIV